MLEYFRHLLAKRRQKVLLEPGIALQPQIVAGAGVRHRYSMRPAFAPTLNRFGNRGMLTRQMIALCILTDDQRKLEFPQTGKQRNSPGWSAFGSRRQIAGFTRSGKAKSHGQDGDFRCVVEYFARDSQPSAQPVTAGVVERQPCFMNYSARRLGRDKDSGRGMDLNNWARAQRQMFNTQVASANLGKQYGKRFHTGNLRSAPIVSRCVSSTAPSCENWRPQCQAQPGRRRRRATNR